MRQSEQNKPFTLAVFQNWIREGNRIIGLKNWSSQGSSNGIYYIFLKLINRKFISYKRTKVELSY